MKADRWDNLKSIFADAAELPESRRGVFLDEACGGDAELRREVEKLLEQVGDETATASLMAARPLHTLGKGQLLAGRFEIRRYVGRGGMGEVYEAEDRELGGQVAVKIIRPDLLDDPEFINRFRREVQLARQVTHPNICRVFDVGFDNPPDAAAGRRLFLTMEFLDGETLGHFLRRRHALSPEAAFPLIRQMAEGLAALHEKSIIHRDFKPGNVMVVRKSLGNDRAVINDFGLARAVTPAGGDASQQQSSQHWGTPDYMSPEQLLGRPLTPASDVYALGLVMYEMVTGKRAFPGGRPLENAMQRLVEHPTPPAEESGAVSPAWNAVILRCLDKDPALRPAAVDIAPALAGVDLPPVSTGPVTRPVDIVLPAVQPAPPPLPVAPRWWASPRTLAMFSVALALLLGVFRYTGWPGSGDGLGGAKDTSEKQVALLPLRVPGDDPKLSAFAQGLMESINSRLSQFEVGTAPLVVVPASEVRSQDAKTARDAMTKFRATTAVEGTLASEGDQVRLLLTVIDTRGMRQLETIQLQDLRSNSFRLQDAAVMRLAKVLNARLLARHTGERQAMSALEPGAYDFYLQARGYLQRNDQPTSLASAVTLLKRAVELDPNFALAHSSLGEAYLYRYKLENDPKLMELASAAGTKGLELNANLAGPHVSLGRILQGMGRDAEALAQFQKAVELDPRDNEAVQGLANSYSALKQYDRAEATYREAIAMRSGDWTGYKQLGLYYYRRGEISKAIEQYQKVVALTPDSAHGHVNLAAFYLIEDQFDKAKEHLTKALELDPNRLSTLTNLARIYAFEGQDDRAAALYERALAANPRAPRVLGQLAISYKRLGNDTKARENFTRAIEMLEGNVKINPKNVDSLGLLARYKAFAGDRRSVVSLVDRFLAVEAENKETYISAAETLAVYGDTDRAIALARKAMSLGYPEKRLRLSAELRPLTVQILSKP